MTKFLDALFLGTGLVAMVAVPMSVLALRVLVN